MSSSNQAPKVALRCLRRLSEALITNATISDTSAVAELSKTAGKLWTLVADTWNSSGTNATVKMLPPGVLSFCHLGWWQNLLGPAPAPRQQQAHRLGDTCQVIRQGSPSQELQCKVLFAVLQFAVSSCKIQQLLYTTYCTTTLHSSCSLVILAVLPD
jgi:hypothetical protein